MGVPVNIMYLDPHSEVKHAFSSHERMRDVFAYASAVSLEDGLERMAQWARGAGAKQSKRFSGVEVRKNMPKSWLEEFSPESGEIR